LGLGVDPNNLKWYVQGELVNGRFAMLAVAGILVPELLGGAGLGGPAAKVAWYNAGAYEYFAPASSLAMVMMILFAWVEMRRYQVRDGVWAARALAGCLCHIAGCLRDAQHKGIWMSPAGRVNDGPVVSPLDGPILWTASDQVLAPRTTWCRTS
jgi:hypothetical protein